MLRSARVGTVEPESWRLSFFMNFFSFSLLTLAGKDAHSAGRYSTRARLRLGRNFGMAEGNIVTKNARSEVKEFATEM